MCPFCLLFVYYKVGGVYMLKIISRSFLFTLSFVILSVFSGIYSFATEGNTDNPTSVTTTNVLDEFDWTQDALTKAVKANEASAFIEPAFGILELENLKKEIIKDFGTLDLNSGFSRSRISTFSKTKTLTGVGLDKTVVGLYTFHYESVTNAITQKTTTNIVATQDRLVTVGLSGLFNETINLDYIGDNYVFIAVKSPVDDSVVYRIFKIVRKEEKIQESLENIKINFY